MVRSHARRSGISSVDDLESESVSTEVLSNGPWAGTNGPNRKAKLATTGELILHVSQSGDDSNEGTQANPVETINEAISRIPKRVHHKVRVFLDYGDYSGAKGPRIWHHTTFPISGSSGEFRIVGHDSENPYYDDTNTVEDVSIPYGISSGNRGTEAFGVFGITIDGVWQIYNDTIKFKNCVFKNGGFGTNVGLDGYLSQVRVISSTFKNLGRAVSINQNGHVTLLDCDGENISGRAYTAGTGSTVVSDNSDAVYNAATTGADTSEGSRVWGGPEGITFSGALGVPFNVEVKADGGGYLCTTPDGSERYRIRVDNSGNVVTEQF